MDKDQAIQKAGRERQKRWREKRKTEGRKVLTVTLSKEAKIILEDLKEWISAQYFSYQRLDSSEFGLRYIPMFARKLFSRLWHRWT